MKIALSGAHRTGKTTLVEELHEALPGYSLYREAYYCLAEEGHAFAEVPRLDDFLAQLEYAIGQITGSEKDALFDRSPLDYLAYIHAMDAAGLYDFAELYREVECAMADVDLLVFIPIEVPDAIGCPESELPELRLQVDEILRDWHGDFESELLEVRGTVSARSRQILRHIHAAHD